MPQLSIVPLENGAGVVLPAEILASMGLRIGDVVDVTLEDRQLILQSVEDAARRRAIDQIIEDQFERRRDAYQRLA